MRSRIKVSPGRILGFFLALAVVAVPFCLFATDAEKGQKAVGESITAVSYDESKDHTDVGFSDVEVKSATDRQFLLSVGCGYDGPEPAPPDQCFVGLTVRINRQTYSTQHDTSYSVIADGKTVVDKLFKNYGVDRDGELWVEPLVTLWAWDQLRAAASGKEVIVKLPDESIPLEPRVIAGLRDIVAHFE